MKTSEGARQLLASGDSIRVIAEKIGVSKEMARQLRIGGKLPAADTREALENAYGIPLAAWDQAPKAKGKKGQAAKPAAKAKAARTKSSRKVATSPPEVVATSVANKVATAEVDAHALERGHAEQRLREQLDRLDAMRESGGGSPAMLIQIERIETQALRELGRITGEISVISEETIMRHPAFKRVMEAVREALDKHPYALEDVATALERLEG